MSSRPPPTDDGSPLALLYRLVGRLYGYRRWIAAGIYAGIAAVSYVAGYVFRFEFRVPPDHRILILQSLPLLLLVRIGTNWSFRLSSERWRFIGMADALRLASATTVGTGVFFLATRLIPFEPAVPRSVILIEWALTTYFTAGIWVLYRTVYERFWRQTKFSEEERRRVLIVGAGEAGNLLAREIIRSPSALRIAGFVDDDPMKWGSTLQGREVIGATEDLPKIADATGADELIVAIPSADPADLRRIVEHCESTGLRFRILPGITEVLEGEVRLTQLREVRLQDLLGREPVKLELPELAEDLEGRIVLITGAAGSIGSELARQVALHGPRRVVLFDQAETALYYLDLELRESFPEVETVLVVGDVVDDYAVERVCTEYEPDRVFHAAAYKHVPVMESNLREAVRNNVLGTWCVADAAGRAGVEKFVLVSTDKAVRPASVMGASKRLAELVILHVQRDHPGTSFLGVRFGNVLGSAGSVIPVFKKQIRDGRPLTVTHPEATRYFMTIPEAVQLILQASVLPEVKGRIAMLDMGEPVRIMEMAENLLRLSGKDPEDGGIVVTGLRPGEKLHEELVAPEEETVPTRIPQIRLIETVGASRELDDGEMARFLDRLRNGEGSEGELRGVLVDAFRGLELDVKLAAHEVGSE